MPRELRGRAAGAVYVAALGELRRHIHGVRSISRAYFSQRSGSLFAGVDDMTSRHSARAFRFTKAGAMHTSATDLGNVASSAIVALPPGATFLTTRTDTGLEHVLVTPDFSDAESVAFAIARSMNARSDEVDEVPDLTRTAHVARLRLDRGSTPRPDTQAGADFTVLSRVIGDMLKPGEWVAMAVRKPSKAESRHNKIWLEHFGVRTHHSLAPNAVVMQLLAGGTDARRAMDLTVRTASAIPGFGLNVTGEKVSPAKLVTSFIVLAVLLVGAGIASMMIPQIAWPWWWTSIPAAVASVVVAVLFGRQVLPSFARSVRRLLPWGQVPVPSRRFGRWQPPKAARTVQNKETGALTEVPAQDGDYPLQENAFLVGPHLPLAFVSPHTGAGSGSASTAARSVPGELRAKVGPRAGVVDDSPVHLSYADMWECLAAIGQPGSGKTALLEHLWGSLACDRKHPGAAFGLPARNAMVAFDTKGDGKATEQYAKWMEFAGDQPDVFHVADPTALEGIELFPDLPGQTAHEWARDVVSAMQYIWGEESIGARSFDTLTNVMQASKLIARHGIAERVVLRTLPTDASPWFYANLLLTNEGDEIGTELFAALADAAVQPDAPAEMAQAVATLSPIYGSGVTQAQRRQLVEAPRTKISALVSAEHWWSRPSTRTWDELLDQDRAVVINTGISPWGHVLDEKLRTDLSSLMLFTLRSAIRRTCVGWFESDRAVWVFADEVKHIANVSAEVISWMRNDARAYGLRCMFATQTPDTLIPELRRVLLGFGTLVLFKQKEGTTVREIVATLTLSGTTWDTPDLVNLRRYEAIISTTYDGSELEPFNAVMPDYRGERDAGTWAA